MIAQYIGHPMVLYVGEKAVYATTDRGYVGRASKDGSDLRPLAMPGFASSAFSGTLLAEDGDRLFLTRNDGSAIRLSFCLTSGCDSTATAIGGPYTQYFAVDQGSHKIVWLDYSPARFMSASTVGTISPIEVPGGAVESTSNIGRLFYSHGGVYFAVPGENNVDRIPISGGLIVGVTYGSAPLSILGANRTSLFLYDGSSIGSISLPSGDSGKPKALIPAVNLNLGGDGRFAADDGAIYWMLGNQAITCEISNCSGTQKALPKRAGDSIWDVGVDGSAIYLLAESGDAANPAVSTVWKLAK